MKDIALEIPRPWRTAKMVLRKHPEHWHELTTAQFIALLRLMNKDISEDDLLMEMLDLPVHVLRRIEPYQRYVLSKSLHFLQDTMPMNQFIIGHTNGLHAPAKGLANVSFGEFIFMDTYFLDLCDDEKMALHHSIRHKFIACLYTPLVKGKRPEFTGAVNTSKAEKVNALFKQGIVLNYGLVRTWLERAYPLVFPKEEKSAKKGIKKQGNGWIDVLNCLVGDDLLSEEQWLKKPCCRVLDFMNRQIKQNRKK